MQIKENKDENSKKKKEKKNRIKDRSNILFLFVILFP